MNNDVALVVYGLCSVGFIQDSCMVVTRGLRTVTKRGLWTVAARGLWTVATRGLRIYKTVYSADQLNLMSYSPCGASPAFMCI